DTPLGSWRGRAVTDSAVSFLEGVTAAVGPEVEVRYAQGAPIAVGERSFVSELQINTDDRSGFGEAVTATTGADVVLFAFGEEAFQSGEGRSQVDIGLAGVQHDLLRAILDVNPNVVGVLMTGRPLALPFEAEALPALLLTWHLGSQAGHAIADVVFGDHNPSGKLPVSFPRHVGQMPLYYNAKNTGRPAPPPSTGPPLVFWSHYTDSPNSALFPFGHGLSYTRFEIGEPEASSSTMERGGELRISAAVKNTGDRAGTEVVQLYIRDLVGSTTRPVKELKDFRRVTLDAGAEAEVVFVLTEDDLAFHTARGAWGAEPGDFEVFVGGSSVDVRSTRFTLR
ncbi:MAG: glycoside hydrolase family 3 C-terminal domain-containing protein, partial [Acidobacteriota bacterium]